MKVLWFTITPSLSDEHINDLSTGGSWVKSLEKVMQTNIDLSIAFYTTKNAAPFKYGNSHYYPMQKYKMGFLSKLINRIFNKLESENDIKLYLEIIENVKPDVIHIHGTETPFGLIQKYTKVPVLVSIQGNITVYQHKYYSGISPFDIFKYSSFKSLFFLRTFNLKYSYFKKQAKREQEILNCSKYIIGRTHWDRRISKVLSPSSTYFHNDEILRDAFYENKWIPSKNNELVLMTTNGPNIYKGIETLIFSANLLESLNINFKWKVAGLNLNDEIVNIACKSIGQKISKNIVFLGSLKVQSLVNEMLNSDIYISISHIENSPNSLCEALLLGLPCIATCAGGTQSLLVDSEDGILIQDGDPYVMTGAILELNTNKNSAVLFGKKAREKALIRHNKDKIKKELLSIYFNITANSN